MHDLVLTTVFCHLVANLLNLTPSERDPSKLSLNLVPLVSLFPKIGYYGPVPNLGFEHAI